MSNFNDFNDFCCYTTRQEVTSWYGIENSNGTKIKIAFFSRNFVRISRNSINFTKFKNIWKNLEKFDNLQQNLTYL